MQLIQRRERAVSDHFHRTIGKIARNSAQAELLGLDAGAMTKVDALNFAGDDEPTADGIHGSEDLAYAALPLLRRIRGGSRVHGVPALRIDVLSVGQYRSTETKRREWVSMI